MLYSMYCILFHNTHSSVYGTEYNIVIRLILINHVSLMCRTLYKLGAYKYTYFLRKFIFTKN